MPKAHPSALSTARELNAYGFNVLPVHPRQKAPFVPWKKWAVQPTTSMLPTWFSDASASESNYWIACGGVSNVYVLDIDNQEAERWWREVVRFGDSMDTTACVKTAKGHHYYFWVDSDDTAKGWAHHSDGISFDVRGAGGGVVAPPSIHPSGAQYQWLRRPDPDMPHAGLVVAPEWLKSAEGVRARVLGHEVAGSTKETGGLHLPGAVVQAARQTNVSSMLSALLTSPPAEGGRNDWLAKVAGHYAKTYRKQRDLYDLHLDRANQMLTPPLDAHEFDKLRESIWSSEAETHPERNLPDTGWVTSAGDCLLTQVKVGKGSEAELQLVEWANFDLKVRGVISGSGDGYGNLLYDCILTRKGDRTEIPCLIEGQTLGNSLKTNTFFAEYGVNIARPDGCYPQSPADNVRLQRYLESQEAPRWKMAPAMGWDDDADGFLTADGVIRADGPHKFDQVRPDPKIATTRRANFAYGFDDGYRQVLAEVLTYQDPDVMSVFGAWWAACLVKPQMQKATSMFPLMAIEGASESGKTNGAFNLMMQLNGSLQGPGTATMASMRDRLASHRNGIVWIDDLDDMGNIGQLLRVTANGEMVTKKDIDNTGNVNVHMVAPLVVSGEQLGLGDQKATMDRIILLNPPKPTGRMSQKPGREDLPQWDDIVALTSRHPLSATGGGLTVYAGSLVQAALQLVPQVIDRLRSYMRVYKTRGFGGRQADKLAILQAGAWLLDRLVVTTLLADDVGEHERRVIQFNTTSQAVSYSAGDWDNRLTREILPWALREHDLPTTPIGRPPAWVAARHSSGDDLLADDVTVWVNVSTLTDAWRDHMRGQVVARTDSRQAITDQLVRCADPSTPKPRPFDITHGGNRQQARYRALTGEAARVVLERVKE